MSSSEVSPRNAQRRSIGIVVLCVAAGYMAYRATTVSWFMGAFLDAPTETWKWVSLDPATLASAGILTTPTGNIPAMYTVFGVPAPAAWIAAGVTLGVVAVAFRLGVLALLGVGAVWMARAAAVGVNGILTESPELGDRFALDGSGYAQFLDWTWILMALLVLAAAQITYAGHLRRRAAAEAGETVEPNLLEMFHNMQTTAVARVSGAHERSDAGKTPAKTGS